MIMEKDGCVVDGREPKGRDAKLCVCVCVCVWGGGGGATILHVCQGTCVCNSLV